MPNLDGKDVIKPTPFDAHEQTVRGTHVPSGPDTPDPSTLQEFPKHVKVGEETVIVNNAEEEAKLKGGLVEPGGVIEKAASPEKEK